MSMPTYVTTLFPIHAISLTNAVHLFVDTSRADPVRGLIDHMKRKPSLASPSVARYCEFGLNATARIPKECSVNIEIGASVGASFAVEKIMTRGLYPV